MGAEANERYRKVVAICLATGELGNFARACKPLLARYAHLPADQFSSRRLKDVQEAMVRLG